MGYLIPEEPQPEGYICLKVYIPDDPLYLYAFSGQLHDMGTWLVWDRDGTARAALAARRWKEAIDYTYLNGWLNCGEDMNCCDQIDDIVRRLEELENMNINVNCGGGCGCGCGGSGSSSPVPTQDDGSPVTLTPPVPPSDTESEPESGWKCDAAHQFYDDWHKIYTDLYNAYRVGNGTVGVVGGILGAVGIITGVGLIAVGIVTLVGGLAVTLFEWVKNWLENNDECIVCAIYSGVSPASSYNNFLAYLATQKANTDGYLAGQWVENLLGLTAAHTDFNLVYQEDSFTIDASNLGSDCSSCTPVIPPDPSELMIDIYGDGSWYLVPAKLGTTKDANNAEFLETDFVWTYNELNQTFPGLWQEVDFSYILASGRTWYEGLPSDVMASADHGGHVILKLSISGEAGTSLGTGEGWMGISPDQYAIYDVFAQAELNSDLTESEFAAGIAAAFADKSRLVLAGGYHTGLNSVFAMAGISEANDTNQFVVYAVIKATALNSEALP